MAQQPVNKPLSHSSTIVFFALRLYTSPTYDLGSSWSGLFPIVRPSTRAPTVMPRLTRAAKRAQPAPGDSAVAAAVALPATPPSTKRMPLGEISGNQEELPTPVENPEQILKANKGPGKGKKGKSSKKSKGLDEAGNTGKSTGVLPDEVESETSSAVDDACQDLLKDGHEGKSAIAEISVTFVH